MTIGEIVLALVTIIGSIGGAWFAARSERFKATAAAETRRQELDNERNLELNKLQDNIRKQLWEQLQGEILRLQKRIDELETENKSLRDRIYHLEEENRRLRKQQRDE